MIFLKKGTSYNLRNMLILPKKKKKIKSAYHRSGTISYLGAKIWNLVLESIKDSGNVNNFKSKIKFWKSENCQLILCKVYLSQIRFICLGVFSKLNGLSDLCFHLKSSDKLNLTSCKVYNYNFLSVCTFLCHTVPC